ncbi:MULTISPECIES: hypothetical protein [unclassified Leptolyngbya]|nr:MULTISPECIES: hypothetical protein [unclassified Leptolyngbya]
MKKLIGLLMAVGLVAILGACEANDVDPDESPVVPPAESPIP